jgi:hypothetical protein
MIGEYPGGYYNEPQTDRFVYGSIYLMDDAESVLPVIDEYEGIGAITEPATA